jgi:hypothetical protein
VAIKAHHLWRFSSGGGEAVGENVRHKMIGNEKGEHWKGEPYSALVIGINVKKSDVRIASSGEKAFVRRDGNSIDL